MAIERGYSITDGEIISYLKNKFLLWAIYVYISKIGILYAT